MKLAILISGQPRNFEQGYEELKETYLSKYDCDIFYHTWDSWSFEATQFFKDRPANKYNMPHGWKEELALTYLAVNSEVETPKVFDNKGIVDPLWRQPLQNSKSMWYSVMRAFALTKPGYDVYIRTRFDLRYEPSLTDISQLDLSKLHVWDWDTDSRVKHRGLYDVFAVGTYETMGIYSSLFQRMDFYLKHDAGYQEFLRGGWPGQDSGLRNEYLLRWHLKTSGVPVEIHPNIIPHADGHIIR
jgi:hypothetical protein